MREGEGAGQGSHALLGAGLAPIARHHLRDQRDNETVDDQVDASLNADRAGGRVGQGGHEDGHDSRGDDRSDADATHRERRGRGHRAHQPPRGERESEEQEDADGEVGAHRPPNARSTTMLTELSRGWPFARE